MKKKILYFNMTDFNDISYENNLLNGDEEYEIQMVNGVSDSEILKYGGDASAIALDYTPMTDRVMKGMPECRVVVRRGIGFDGIDLGAATRNGICACNVPNYCQEDVALHTITLALSCARHITELNGRMQKADGSYDDIKMYRLSGKTYGLLSFGSIPRAMTPILKALGFRVIAWDPYLEDTVFCQYGVERVMDMDEMLKQCHFVSVHVPLNAETKNLLNEERLALLPEGAVVVNTARGGIIDETALRDAMLRGHVRGAGLDVIEDETSFTSPLQDVPNAILTPHVAYFSEESSMELRRKTFETMYGVLKTGKYPATLLNKDVIGQSKLEG